MTEKSVPSFYRSLVVLRLLITLLFVCSCRLRPPLVDVTGVGFRMGDSLRVYVVAYNPNRFRVQVSDLKYTLSTGDVRIGSGRISGNITIEGRDTVRTDLPLGLEVAALLRVLPQALEDSPVLSMNGSCWLSAPLFRHRIEFHAEDAVGFRERLIDLLEGGE